MKQELIIKIQGKQHEKGRGWLVLMLLCFIVALVILMIYSSRYFWALLVPIFYILLRFKNLSAEKRYIIDAVCTINRTNDGIEIDINSTQSKVCCHHRIANSEVNLFQMDDDGKVTLDFNLMKNKTSQRQVLEFYTMRDDRGYWEDIIQFSKPIGT